MKLYNKLEIDSTLKVGAIPTASTSNFSVLFENGGLVSKRVVGDIINKNTTDFIQGISNSFPSIFNYNTSTTPSDSNLVVSFKNQLAGTVFAAPTTLNGTPSFRKLIDSDLSETSIFNQLGNFVPYTGADQPINLNTQQLTSGTQFLNNTKSFSIGSTHLGINTNIPGYFKINLTPYAFYGTTFNLTISGSFNSNQDYGIVQLSGTLNSSTNDNNRDFIFHTVKGHTGGVTINSRGFYIEPKQYVDENGIYYIKAWKRHSLNVHIYVEGSIRVGNSDTDYEPNIEFVEDATPVTLYNNPNYLTENQGRYLSNTVSDLGYTELFSGDLNTLPNGSYIQAIGGSSSNGASGIGTPRSLISFGARSLNDSILQSDILIGTEGFAVRNRTNNIWRTAWHSGNFNPAQYVLQSALNTQLANYVPINGVTTINNTKTFTSSPIVPNATLDSHAVNLGQVNSLITSNAIQTLSIGTQKGQFSISGGNSIKLDSLTTATGINDNILDFFNSEANINNGHGLKVFRTTAGATGVPTQLGGGILFQRNSLNSGGNVLSGSFALFKSHNSDNDKLYLSTGTGTTTMSDWRIIATEEWVNSQGFVNQANTIAFNTTTVNPTNSYNGLDADTVLNSSRVFYVSGTNVPNATGFLDTTVFSNGAFQMSQGDNDNFYYRRRFGGVWRSWNQVASREWVNQQGFSTQTLTAGTNINIVGNVISATNTTYSAGTLALLQAGTNTSNRVWSPKILADGVIRKGVNNVNPEGQPFSIHANYGSLVWNGNGFSFVADSEQEFKYIEDEQAIGVNPFQDYGFYLSGQRLRFTSAGVSSELLPSNGVSKSKLPVTGSTQRTLVVGATMGGSTYYANDNGLIDLPSSDGILSYSSANGIIVTDWNSFALSEYAMSLGYGSVTSGNYATSVGGLLSTTGFGSTNQGYSNSITKALGYAVGAYNSVRATLSGAFGIGLINRNDGAFIVGRYNSELPIVPYDTTSPHTQAVFAIGAGRDDTDRYTALTVFGDGRADYTEGYDDSNWTNNTLVTKKWVLDNAGGSSGGGVGYRNVDSSATFDLSSEYSGSVAENVYHIMTSGNVTFIGGNAVYDEGYKITIMTYSVGAYVVLDGSQGVKFIGSSGSQISYLDKPNRSVTFIYDKDYESFRVYHVSELLP